MIPYAKANEARDAAFREFKVAMHRYLPDIRRAWARGVMVGSNCAAICGTGDHVDLFYGFNGRGRTRQESCIIRWVRSLARTPGMAVAGRMAGP